MDGRYTVTIAGRLRAGIAGRLRAGIAGVLLAGVLGCGREPAPAAPPLAGYLEGLAGASLETRTRAVQTWKLDRASWDAIVIAPYRPLHPEYERHFDMAVPILVERLATRQPIATRAHFAGDPRGTRGQAITRWALPTLAKAEVAELAGPPPVPLDAVFVAVSSQGARSWRALVGLDAIVRDEIAGLAPACGRVLDAIEPAGGRCIEAAWAVADAALQSDLPRFAQACRLAGGLCAAPGR
ncbi:MAG: hypothetical protein H0T89_14010 [Deltaproteobacteria bacterium]|nr:hypothetical protein [Deltaproteobacteria bacterium]